MQPLIIYLTVPQPSVYKVGMGVQYYAGDTCKEIDGKLDSLTSTILI
jgi:hypothetical protein